MSWLFSRALAEAYSEGDSLGGELCAPLNVMPTPHKFWRNDKTMEPSDLSRFGLTCAVLTAAHGEELLTSFRAAFPVKTSQRRAKVQASKGERSGLWKEFARIICEVRPQFVFVENSPRLTSRGLHRVLGDLAQMGYDARWGCVSAADAIWLDGTPALDHERERIWIVAHTADAACKPKRKPTDKANAIPRSWKAWPESGSRSAQIADTYRITRGAGIGPAEQEERSETSDGDCEMSNSARNGRREGGGLCDRLNSQASHRGNGEPCGMDSRDFASANADNRQQSQKRRLSTRSGAQSSRIDEKTSDSARIQQGREKQRTFRQRVRPGSELSGEAKGNSAEISARLGAVQLLPGILVQPPRHARLRMPLPCNRRTGDRSVLRRRISHGAKCRADDDLQRRQEQRTTEPSEAQYPSTEFCGWWQSEPAVGRVAHGVAHRVDRLKAIGNGQVSAVVPLAWSLLKEMSLHDEH